MEEVIVEIDENAAVTVSVRGVKGKRCKEVTAALEKALGDVTGGKPTSEMSEKETTSHVVKR